MPQTAIAQVVRALNPARNDRLLIGAECFSDASVYQLDDGNLMVQSLDFFPPLVDDPFTYGQIAAANSLSDIFAMGATPLTALNIVAFPDDKLELSILSEILRGGEDKVRESGAVTAGGHTVRDQEIKYGLSVTGICSTKDLLHNSGAQPGNLLVLTKPLGTGFLTTAMKRQKATEDVRTQAIRCMTLLNDHASRSAVKFKATSVTDITGFGLAGHAKEMANGSDVTLIIELNDLPALPGAKDAYQRGFLTRASASNRDANASAISGIAKRNAVLEELLFDPQTSGGLLVSLPPEHAESYVNEVSEKQGFGCVIIGEVIPRKDSAIVIH